MNKVVSLHHSLLKSLLKHKVDFVIVGVSGINYYAQNASHFLSTMDYDIFLKPDIENLYRTLKVLMQQDFNVCYKTSSQKLKLIQKPSKTLCEKLVKNKSVLIAEGSSHAVFDLLQQISGFTFQEIKKCAVKMRDKKLKFAFPVGRLEDLLESKRLANREKDIFFLKKYRNMFMDPS